MGSETSTNTKKRVAFLLLDGAELDTFEYFRASGDMPNIDRLFKTGQFQAVKSRATYSAEATPTEMISGERAEDTKYFSMLDFDPQDYSCTNVGAHLGPGFYDRKDIRSIVFDCPHMQIRNSPGIQVAAWGCHSAQYPRASNPPHVIVEMEKKFGTQHTPDFEDIHSSHNLLWAEAFTDHVLDSLEKRPKIIKWLMDQEPDWDLMVLGSTEPHMHEHSFHHTVDETHELYNQEQADVTREMMRSLFISVDKMVGEVEAMLPENTTFVVGSVHGAMASGVDSSGPLAAELVYRDQTGKKMLDLPLKEDGPVELEYWQRARGYMQRYKVDAGKPTLPGTKESVLHYTRWFIHRYMPGKPERFLELASRRAAGQTKEYWIRRKPEPLTEPQDISNPRTNIAIASEPANWYQHAWPEMRFFVIPSFSGLQLRVNLEGREKDGIVKAQDYEATLDEIEELLRGCTNAFTGESLVEVLERPRLEDPFARDGASCDVAIVFKAASTIEHPKHGTLGTIPYGRVAEHSDRGWLVASGEGVKSIPGEIAKTIDVGPTLLTLLGVEPEARLKGRPVFGIVRETVRT